MRGIFGEWTSQRSGHNRAASAPPFSYGWQRRDAHHFPVFDLSLTRPSVVHDLRGVQGQVVLNS